jgi:hypothetical protein
VRNSGEPPGRLREQCAFSVSMHPQARPRLASPVSSALGVSEPGQPCFEECTALMRDEQVSSQNRGHKAEGRCFGTFKGVMVTVLAGISTGCKDRAGRRQPSFVRKCAGCTRIGGRGQSETGWRWRVLVESGRENWTCGDACCRVALGETHAPLLERSGESPSCAVDSVEHQDRKTCGHAKSSGLIHTAHMSPQSASLRVLGVFRHRKTDE